MWPSAYSPAPRTSRTSGGSSPLEQLGQAVGPDRLDPRHRALLRPPGAHPAAEEAAHPQPDRGEQLRGLELVAVGGGDDDDLAVGRNDLGDLGGEAGVVAGGADRAGDVGLVELLVGARVDGEGAGGDRRLEAARRQPGRASRSTRPAGRG